MSKKTRILIIAAAIIVLAGATGGTALKLSYNPSFCATVCHVMEKYDESYMSESAGMLAHAHAEAGVVCKDCHHTDIPQQVREIAVTITGQYDEPLRERRVEKEQCLACHEHESYAQLREMTADVEPVNPHDSHLDELECRLCHKMHRPSEDYCEQCHAHGFDVP